MNDDQSRDWGMIGTDGLATAVAEAHDRDEQPPGVVDGEQMALLPLPLRNATASEPDAQKVDTAGRGPGRPPGAKNKSTKQWTQYLLTRYRSPLEALAEIYCRPLPELCAELMSYAGAAEGSKPSWDRIIEVLKIQMGAAKELAPYVHQKQPMAIDGGENGIISLFIGGQAQGSVRTSEAQNFDFDILDVESEENQGVRAGENQKSNEPESNGFAESCGEREFQGNEPTDLGSVKTSEGEAL